MIEPSIAEKAEPESNWFLVPIVTQGMRNSPRLCKGLEQADQDLVSLP